jgi:hypothetical protein
MSKGIFVTLCAACLWGGAALAQTGVPGTSAGAAAESNAAAEPNMVEPNMAEPLHAKFVTATGATVPRPALLPKDSLSMRSGRSVYEKDRRIENSLCSNC